MALYRDIFILMFKYGKKFIYFFFLKFEYSPMRVIKYFIFFVLYIEFFFIIKIPKGCMQILQWHKDSSTSVIRERNIEDTISNWCKPNYKILSFSLFKQCAVLHMNGLSNNTFLSNLIFMLL